MVQLSLKKHITAAPEEVFALFADLENAAEHIKSITRMELLTEGPVRLGTRFKETRVMFKKETVEEFEVTAFDPPLSYTISAESCGCSFESVLRFAPNDGGTDVYFDMQSEPLTFSAKLMAPISKLFMGTMRKCMEADLDDLREVAEQRNIAAQAGADE
jgi:Polyketide cyclase / dehydrase and lipid transport